MASQKGLESGTGIGGPGNEKEDVIAQSRRDTGFFTSRRLMGPVKKDGLDYVLLAHSLATGMVDAASFSNWGVFCGMQTGR